MFSHKRWMIARQTSPRLQGYPRVVSSFAMEKNIALVEPSKPLGEEYNLTMLQCKFKERWAFMKIMMSLAKRYLRASTMNTASVIHSQTWQQRAGQVILGKKLI